MTYEQIIQDLKDKKYCQVYFLMGEEDYFIDNISNILEETILSEEEKAFNQIILYGKDIEKVTEVMTSARRYPMMAPYQVIIVKEAQHIRNISRLAEYVDNPMPTTILVFCYRGKRLDKRKTLARKLNKQQVLFDSKRLYDNQVMPWVINIMKTRGYTIEPKAAALLAEFLGTSLSKLNNELEKLQIIIPKGSTITVQHIEENIGISKDYNNFELQNALGKRNIEHAIRIVKYFGANTKNHPFVVTVSVLFSFFSKLLTLHYLLSANMHIGEREQAQKLGVHPFFLKDYRVAIGNYSIRQVVAIISLLRTYDLKSKGSDNIAYVEGELLSELMFKILYR